MKKKKIAIVTWHYYPNFGSVLQAYALQEQLRSLGYDPMVLDYRNKKYGVISPAREVLVYLLGKMNGQIKKMVMIKESKYSFCVVSQLRLRMIKSQKENDYGYFKTQIRRAFE